MESFFVKLHGSATQLKQGLRYGCFPGGSEIFENNYFAEHPRVTASNYLRLI